MLITSPGTYVITREWSATTSERHNQRTPQPALARMPGYRRCRLSRFRPHLVLHSRDRCWLPCLCFEETLTVPRLALGSSPEKTGVAPLQVIGDGYPAATLSMPWDGMDGRIQ